MMINRRNYWGRRLEFQAEAGPPPVLKNSRQTITCRSCLLEAEARVRHARPDSTRSKIIVAVRSPQICPKEVMFLCLWAVCEKH